MISGALTATNINVTGSTVPANGMYLPATNSVSIATNNTQQVTVDTNGFVGIGTTAPSVKLHINGSGSASSRILVEGTASSAAGGLPSIVLSRTNSTLAASDFQGTLSWLRTLTDSSTIGSSIQSTGTNNSAAPTMNLTYNAYTSHQFQTNGTERMRIDAGGNVAIGTSSPTIYGSGYTTLAVNGTTTGLIDWMSNGARYGTAYNIGSDFLVANATSNSLILGTNNTERMRIDPNGNVAIGSGTATTKLYVQTPMLTSAANAQAFGQTIYTADGSNGQSLQITNNRSPAGGSDWTSSGFRIQQKTDATYQGYIQFNNGSGSVTNNYGISFGTGGSTLNQNGVPEAMRIDANGNVSTTGTTATTGYNMDLKGLIRQNGNRVLDAAGGATITGGYYVSPYNIGTISSGTVTPSAANGNYQYYTNNGAHTIASPSTDCAIDVYIINGASAGSVTLTTGTSAGQWYVGSSTGSALTTTNGNIFLFSIRRINGYATYSIYALQ